MKRHTVADTTGGTSDLKAIVPHIARNIALADPGSAAALRRGPLSGSGSAAFWKLLADSNISSKDVEAWAAVVQSIAILTPVGCSTGGEKQGTAHDPRRPMGAAFYDAGVSELRLARLLAAKGGMRRELLVRLSRRVARTDHRQFDLRTLAWFILRDDERTDRTIARDYYRAERREIAAARAKEPQIEEQ